MTHEARGTAPSRENHHGPDHPHDHPHDHGHGFAGALRELFVPHSHDPADSIDGPLESNAAGIRAVKVSLVALAATAVAQLVVVYFSGSVALFADTVHNFADALTAIPLWIAFALGARPATRRYTYGFGRAEDLAGLFVIAMIAVSAVVAAKAAGVDENGDIDLIWINGENFVNMKRQDLLLEAGWTQKLPNWQFVDWKNKPTILTDFTEPTDGRESPWGMAKMVFFHDTARDIGMPDSFAGLVEWTEKNPGRFSYPAPPDFIGSSFLKQALTESVADPSVLLKPAAGCWLW